MIIFTELGDTPESVAERYLGYHDKNKTKAIRDANRESMAWELMNGDGSYADNRAIWFPLDGEDTPFDMQQLIVHEFDWVFSDKRRILAQAQKAKLSMHHLFYTHQLTTLLNLGASAGTVTLDSIHATLEIRQERLKDFEKVIDRTRNSLGELGDATTETARNAAKTAFADSYLELTEQYSHYLRYMDAMAPYRLTDTWQIMRDLPQQGWLINSLFEAKKLVKMVKYLRVAVIGGYALLVVEGINDTIETWKHTHSWEATAKAAAEALADIGVLAGATALMGLLLVMAGVTAPEWGVCLLAGAGATITANMFNKFLLNPAIEAV